MHTDQQEQDLVARLRKSDAFITERSLVDQEIDKIVGYALFTKMHVKSKETTHEVLALAPVAVLPEYQGKGIGSQLLHRGLEIAKELGFKVVIVLGHDKYYPKFVFKVASSYGIEAPFEVPESNFMALELIDKGLEDVNGVRIYASAFFEA